MYLFADHNLIVFDELPKDAVLTDSNGWPNESMRDKFKNDLDSLYDTDRYYYYCKECKGYVKGIMNEQGENSLGPLCGRLGKTYNCCRCGWELDFQGCIS
jgi:hypothetical protein